MTFKVARLEVCKTRRELSRGNFGKSASLENSQNLPHGMVIFIVKLKWRENGFYKEITKIFKYLITQSLLQ